MLRQGYYIQQWQYGSPTAAEQSIDDVIALALKYKAAGIFEKVMDGTSYMGVYASLSPYTLEDVIEHKQKCDTAGIHYVPWVNPLWGTRSFLDQEASLYAEIGEATGFLAWDVEPYAGFWGPNRSSGDAAYLMRQFKLQAPACVNVWQPDPRASRLAELRPEEWYPYMDVYAPQSYWADFGTHPDDEIVSAKLQATAYGLGCAPTIPATGSPEEFERALNRMGDLGILTCVAWRLGSLNYRHLEVLRDLAGHEDSACAELKDQAHALAESISEQVSAMREKLDVLDDLSSQLDTLSGR